MMGNKDYLSEGCDMGWAIKTIFLEGVIWVDVQHPPPPPPPHTHTHTHTQKKIKIWILCQNSLTRELKIRVVGFVLKKLLTYFEMLIVPHALQCVDGCFFVFYRI